MNEFFADFFPLALLFDRYDIVRILGMVFIVIFSFLLFLFLRKEEGINGDREAVLTGRRKVFLSAILFLGVMCGMVVFLESDGMRSELSLQEEEWILSPTEPLANIGEKGEALGETDENNLNTAIPKSESYHLGFVAVGGDNQLYLAPNEEERLEISHITYKAIIDESKKNPGAIVHWKTNKPARGEVLYRKSSDEGFRSVKEASFELEHTIILEELGHQSVYVIAISSIDKWGNEEKSQNYALYSGSDSPSLFNLLSQSFGDIFGWAMREE